MGEDNLEHFRKWRHWREVATSVPVAIVSRPDAPASGRLSAQKDWTFLTAPYHEHSSTALRKKKPKLAKAKRK